MKKVILGLVALSILLISSCSNNVDITPVGSWTFKGATNNPTGCKGDSSKLIASAGSNILTLTFYNSGNNLLPQSNSSYTVTNTTPGPNQVLVQVTVGTSVYTPTAAAVGSQVVVGISSLNYRVNAYGGPIELVNTSTPADSSAINFSVFQTQ